MPYITGTISDFESRAHQIPLSGDDIYTGFIVEGRSYLAAYGTGIATGKIPPQMSGKWENELRLSLFSIGGINSGILLNTQQL